MNRDELSAEVLTAVKPLEPETLSQLSGRIEALTQVQTQGIATVRENTAAVIGETNARTRSASQPVAEVKAATSSLGDGLFLSPLIRGIASLFGRREKPEPPPLIPFERPAANRIEAGLGFGDTPYLALNGYSQEGLQRAASPFWRPANPELTRPEAAVAPPTSATRQSVPGPTAVTIQINALDSRSILDRSDDIARAVQQAMLHSHSLNGTIGEL